MERGDIRSMGGAWMMFFDEAALVLACSTLIVLRDGAKVPVRIQF